MNQLFFREIYFCIIILHNLLLYRLQVKTYGKQIQLLFLRTHCTSWNSLPEINLLQFFIIDKPPAHGPCKALDFELEMVIIILYKIY